MYIPFTKYGSKELVISCVLMAAAALLLAFFQAWLAPLPVLGLLFCASFFRDPRRDVPDGNESLVSPADGRVVEISRVEEGEFIGGRATKIGIFLSIFNVHVNRAPCAGTVAFLKYQPGKFHSALSAKASHENETNMLGLHKDGREEERILVKQISGVIARRIVCDCALDDQLEKGQKFGMIKFGSRTEVYIPDGLEIELSVEEGQKVVAGETILGVLRK